MRKILVGLTLFAMMGFIYIPPVKVQAADCVSEQQNSTGIDEGSAAITLQGTDNYYGQTFKTTSLNNLTRVYLYLKNFTATTNLTISIVKNPLTTPSPVASISGDFEPEIFFGGEVNPNTWMNFYFAGHGGVSLETNTEYAIYLKKNSGTASPMWARSGSNAYANGVSIKWGSADATDDFAFMVCGSTIAAENPPATPETPATPDTTTTTQPSTTTQTDSSLNETVGASLQSTDYDPLIATSSLASYPTGTTTPVSNSVSTGTTDSSNTIWIVALVFTVIVMLVLGGVTVYLILKSRGAKNLDSILPTPVEPQPQP